MKMKRILASLLAAACLLGTSACSQPQSGGESQTSSSSGGAKLQVILPQNFQNFPENDGEENIDENNNFIVNYWREKTGFDFDIVILPSSNSTEKLNLMFNGGEVYGIVFDKDPASVSRYYEQGILTPFDDYMEGSYFFETYADSQDKGQIDGKQYGAVIPTDGIPCASGLFLARKDVLSSIGVTSQPEDIDEFTQMLKTIKDKAGMIPLGVYGSPSEVSWDIISSMFGVSVMHNNWCVRDGKVVFRQIQPEAYDYLVYCKELYQSGLIPQDFLSLTEETLQQLYLGEKTATMSSANCWMQKTFMPQSEAKGFDTRYMDYPEGYYGEKSYGNQDRLGASQIAYLSSSCENPQDYVAFLDFLAQPETIKLNNYGVENEHYQEDADGNIFLTEKGKDLSWAVYYRNIFPPEDWYTVYGVNAGWAEYYYPTERHSVGNTDFDPVEFMPQSSQNVALQSQLYDTIITLYYSKAVTGEVELTRETFDAMVQDWLQAGGQALQDEYTAQYQALGSPDYSDMYVSYLPENHTEYTGKYLWDGKE